MDFLSGIFSSIMMFLSGIFGIGEPVITTFEISDSIPKQEVQQPNTLPNEKDSKKGVDNSKNIFMNNMNKKDNSTSKSKKVNEENDNEMIGMPVKADSNEKNLIDEKYETMLVAGGCFWCVESDLEKVPGIIEVISGYAGGQSKNPNYKNYIEGGHREVVKVVYDPEKISFEDILIVAMKTTDPTDDDGTFYDRGNQYSAAFFYETPKEKSIIDKLIAEVNEFGPYDKPLAIDVEERPKFWSAEDYHQDYYKKGFSKLKYKYYRNGSGRDDFIKKYWGESVHDPDLPWRNKNTTTDENNLQSNNIKINNDKKYSWLNYKKTDKDILKSKLDKLTYKVTQEEGTERAGTSPLDKNYEPGIYVDVLSGEPLFSSRDKFNSGTGWPSFTQPITNDAVVKKEDKRLFVTRTEIRSKIADNHLGHVFNDGPTDKGGLRYCMNGVALKFIPKEEMKEKGYGDFLSEI